LADATDKWEDAIDAESAVQSFLLRDIFGPLPFRTIYLDPSVLTWSESIVVRMATAIYENRCLPAGKLDKTRLAVLADALEEAGVASEEILSHCRSQSDHVRGCWLIDLLLGRV
jgi:hypothetical protein